MNIQNIFLVVLSIIILNSMQQCSNKDFTQEEEELILSEDSTEIMDIFLVENRSDSVVLYKKSKEIKPDSNNQILRYLINRMYYTVKDTTNPGVGIAAPQVGINRRIIWVQRMDKADKPFEVYLNIYITSYSTDTLSYWEGCLSINGFRGLVHRSNSIEIEYDLLDGKHYIDTISDFTAIIFQHEIDHLDGILYTDRITDKSLILTDKEYELEIKN